MERLRFRSTSLADLQAELREHQLSVANGWVRRHPVRWNRRTVFTLPVGVWRPRDRAGA